MADALTRITQIQAQIAGLTQGAVPAGSAVAPGTSAAGAQAPGAASGADFQTMLARAQGLPPAGGATGYAPYGTSGFYGTAAGASGPAYGATGSAVPGLGGSPIGLTGGVGAAAGAALPAAATGMLTPGQARFASRLAADTGLSPQVICAWVLAEENQGAARTREAAGNHDWLNIGYTDSGTYGSADGVWRDPTTAADATAGWLRGQNTIPGYGRASSGIQAILGSAGQPPQAQVAAIQSSGWASSGYPDLPALVAQLGA